eukprot:sb/3476030/
MSTAITSKADRGRERVKTKRKKEHDCTGVPLVLCWHTENLREGHNKNGFTIHHSWYTRSNPSLFYRENKTLSGILKEIESCQEDQDLSLTPPPPPVTSSNHTTPERDSSKVGDPFCVVPIV